MDDRLGNERSFLMSEESTPIAYQAAQYFSTSDQRMEDNGGGLKGYVDVTQSNLSEIIRAIANLELEVQELKRR